MLLLMSYFSFSLNETTSKNLCYLIEMHLCSKNLSALAMISSSKNIELFPACFSFSNKFNLFIRIRR